MAAAIEQIMARNDHRPVWACYEWGQYEHDWINCPACLELYESWLEGLHRQKAFDEWQAMLTDLGEAGA